MFKEQNALPTPPSAGIPGIGDLSRDELEAMHVRLLEERGGPARELERLDQQITLVLYYICGATNDLQDVEFYVDQKKLGITPAFVDSVQRPVGHLEWVDDLDVRFQGPGNSPGTVNGEKWGTGALIGRNFFLTAGHCFDMTGNDWERPMQNYQTIRPAEIARLMKVVFDRQVKKTPRPETIFPVVRLLEHCSHEHGSLDYAIVELAPDDQGRLPGDLFGWLPVAATDAEPEAVLSIIQHASQAEKKIDVGKLRGNRCTRLFYNDIDTGPGSSGAPVLNEKGEIVGVHIIGGCREKGGVNAAQAISAIRLVSKLLP